MPAHHTNFEPRLHLQSGLPQQSAGFRTGYGLLSLHLHRLLRDPKLNIVHKLEQISRSGGEQPMLFICLLGQRVTDQYETKDL